MINMGKFYIIAMFRNKQEQYEFFDIVKIVMTGQRAMKLSRIGKLQKNSKVNIKHKKKKKQFIKGYI